MRGASRFIVALTAAWSAQSPAMDAVPQAGRYMPLYPGLYLDAAYTRDPRDSVFRQDGERVDSAETTLLPGHTRLPESRLEATFRWYFPAFESYGVPLLSDQLFTARVQLRHVSTRTEGALRGFVDDTSDDAHTFADQLESDGSGIGDLGLQFGGFLWGSDGWRENRQHRFSVLWLVGANLPTGHYERNAPVSAGTNTWAVDARIAANLRPWSGGFVDGAVGWRDYFKNQDPAFGGLAPSDQGNDVFWDASIGQRLARGLYVSAFASSRRGQANVYDTPRFSPNQPDPPSNADNYPTRGRYTDDGTALTSVGGSLSWFLGQRWLLGLHYTHPLSGRSGEFDLPYTNRSPQGCNIGALGCQESAGDTVHVDGMGPARSYASNRLTLTLNFNFGQGDAFTCTGCERR